MISFVIALFESVNSVLALLEPPREATAPDFAGTYTIVIGAMLAVGVGLCAIDGVRRRTLLPILMLISGLITVTCEPVVDNLGAVWYPTDNPMVSYTAMGVPQPLFLQLGYPLFWGAITYLWYRLLAGGRVSVWTLFGGVLLLDLFVEVLGVHFLDVGIYYGPAPYRVLDFPLWWAPVNAAVSVVGATALYYLVPRLRGLQRLAMLWIAPASFIGTHAICAWPVWFTMHTDVPQVIRWAAATITIGLVALLMTALAKLVAARAA